MIIRRIFPTAMTVAAVAVIPLTAQTAGAATPPAVTLGAHPLGVNVSPQDTTATSTAGWARLQAAEKQLPALDERFGGGTKADTYNPLADAGGGRDTYLCALEGHQSDNWTGPCSRGDSLSFARWAAQVKALRGTGTVTVNYGTGSPALAGQYAALTKGQPVSKIEIGNEAYGCSSADIPITTPPVSDTSYEPNDKAHCPYAQAGSGAAGVTWFARSFIAHGPAYIAAVRTANPAAKILIDYALSPGSDSGHIWNHMVMPAVHNWQGLSVLWYPFHDGTAGYKLPDAAMMVLATQIPARAALIRADLKPYPGRFYDMSEFNANNGAMLAVCHPAAAVFTATSALAWLSQGARTVQYWTQADNNNPAGCSSPEFGMFNSTGAPNPPYYGYLLAGALARPGAHLSAIPSGNRNVLEYRATNLPGHHTAVLYANISTAAKATVAGPDVGGTTAVRTIYNGHLTRATVKVPSRITLSPVTLTVVER